MTAGNHSYYRDITMKDIIRETARLAAIRVYPITGWRLTENPDAEVTLRDLARMWADEENAHDLPERVDFETWLDTHIDDHIVEPSAEGMAYYTLIEQTIVTERRIIRAPQGMNLTEAREWVRLNGDGQSDEILDVKSTIMEIRDNRDNPLKEADND
ncbi:hypothetical protein [Bifidobacterium sp. SO1]|uniref:hypothetical protein n=1 Tax=Bifidobacterium sp. SO1 TaxID=2809029 RepID=UPI001BDC4181|nr:hypothetical protein [Bifidobacterium sp. SO1]MBT1161759.1 hypothetical protein [Bifidobacterium sp. SO1]